MFLRTLSIALAAVSLFLLLLHVALRDRGVHPELAPAESSERRPAGESVRRPVPDVPDARALPSGLEPGAESESLGLAPLEPPSADDHATPDPADVAKILGLRTDELCEILETSRDRETVLAALFALGNGHELGESESRVLVEVVDRWSEEEVRLQALRAIDLLLAHYPTERVLGLRWDSSPAVRAAAISSLGVRLEPVVRRELYLEHRYDDDPEVRRAVEVFLARS